MLNYLKKIFTKKQSKKDENENNLLNFKRKKNKSFIIKINFIDKIKKSHIFALLFIIIILSTIFINSFLRINIVQITKNDDITNLSIAYKSIDRFRGKFLFMVKNEDIKNALLTNQKNIKNINITKLPSNTLKIELESYPPIYKTIFNRKNYIITSNGVFIPTNNKNNDLKNIDINTIKEINFPDYKNIVEEKYLKEITLLEKNLTKNIENIKINGLQYYVTERELHIIDGNNVKIIFDLEGDLDKQIKQLSIFNKQYFNLSKTGMIYIDLRINNKIFYCAAGESGENTIICQNNLTNIYQIKK